MLPNLPNFKLGVSPQDTPLSRTLRDVYRRHAEGFGADDYLARHGNPSFIAGQVALFQWYRRFLPETGCVLDWGCRHAPDSCLIRAEFGPRFQLMGCDVSDPAPFSGFYEFAGLDYRQLDDVVRLPFPDRHFDAVIGSGVLEHVAMDAESLKELWRVLKPGGRLIVTYLPNQRSVSEWYAREIRQSGFHIRLYYRSEVMRLLQRTGFRVLSAGYQSRLDLLHSVQPAWRPARALARLFGLHRFTAGIALAAEKVEFF